MSDEQPITFVEDDDEDLRRSPPAEPGATDLRPEPGDVARPEVEPGSAEAVALLGQRRQQVSQLVQALAIASQQLAQVGYTLMPERGSLTQKRLLELRDGLERSWRLAVAIEASVKED